MNEPNLDYYAASIEEADRFNSNLFLHDIRRCRRCPLGAQCIDICPGWFMKLPLDLLFIGASPGADEDEVGRPFVGRSGKKLIQLCDSINLITPDTMVGFTNIIRCHPPQNRPPTGLETQACSTWLNCELDMTEPKVVLLLGGVAMNLAFEGKKIGEVAGHARAIGSTIYIASYHPAAILHRPNANVEESIMHSLRLAKEVLSAGN